jgi:hypothetical protein
MKLNFPGILAAIATMILPFSGIWWQFRIGEAIIIAFSPFEAEIMVFGNGIIIPLVYWIMTSFKVLIILAGVFMLLASLQPDKWWSAHLMRFGSFKVLGLIVLFLVLILAMKYGSSILLEKSNFPVDFEFPLSGTTDIEIQNNGFTMKFQLSTSFEDVFGFAILTALLGVAAWVYQRRLQTEVKA